MKFINDFAWLWRSSDFTTQTANTLNENNKRNKECEMNEKIKKIKFYLLWKIAIIPQLLLPRVFYYGENKNKKFIKSN